MLVYEFEVLSVYVVHWRTLQPRTSWSRSLLITWEFNVEHEQKKAFWGVPPKGGRAVVNGAPAT